MSDEDLPNAYKSAVREINTIAQFADPVTARQDLAALRALIDTLAAKLPAEESDYATDDSSPDIRASGKG